MPFLEHIKELRYRIIISLVFLIVFSVGAFIFYEPIVEFLSRPFQNINSPFNNQNLFVTHIFEGFTVKIKISFMAGLTMSFPVIVFNILRFILPALRPIEKRVIYVSLFASFFLVIFSVFLNYQYIIPISVKFLTSINIIPEDVGILLNYGKNIVYVFYFLLITLLLFQFPIVLEILLMLGVVKRKQLWSASRYVIIGLFILGSLVTGPDIVSQLAIALPLTVLYFITLLIAKIFGFGN